MVRTKTTTVTTKAKSTRRRSRRPRSNRRRGRRNNNTNLVMHRGPTMSNTMSKAGVAFLKCAFAAPDFNTDPGKGIPDNYSGKTLVRKDVTTNSLSITGNTTNAETFILFLPIPGVAYWTATIPAAGDFPDENTSWLPTYIPGFSDLFGPTNTDIRDSIVSRFRFASFSAEIVATSNDMQYGGSITCWKFPVSAVQSTYAQDIATMPPVTLAQTQTVITGLRALSAVGSENYAKCFKEGIFAQSIDTDATFLFHPIINGLNIVPAQVTTESQDDQFGILNGTVVGCGGMQGMVFRISTPPEAVNAMILKVWSCIEYQVSPTSIFYQSASNSPPEDRVALALYRDIAQKIPLAVPAAQNANFWNRVMSIISRVLQFSKKIPGPIGVIAEGVDSIVDAFGSMVM